MNGKTATPDATATATAAPAPEAATSPEPDDEEELEPAADGPPPVPKGKPSSKPAPAAGDDEPLSVTGHLPVAAWPPKTVADLMTRQVITLRETEAIGGDLEGWMARFRFRHLPVVDGSMRLVGLITRTDLLHAYLGVGPAGATIEKADEKTLAGAIMRRGVVTAQPDASLTTACRVMLHEKLGCLPIILPDSTLVGIVTESDFMRLSLDLLERKS